MRFSFKHPVLIVAIVGIALLGALLVFAVLFKSPQRSALSPVNEPAVSTDGVRPNVMSLKPLKYDENVLNEHVDRACPAAELPCFTKVLIEITGRNGPQASLSALRRLQEHGRIRPAADPHHLTREIGKKTAERFGINGRAFMLCPTSFDYGCQNGFFEHALGQAHAIDNAARLICGSLDESYSMTLIFRCYLGVGHAVLMAQNYDLANALAACDTLETHNGQAGCWQGVFIEHGNRHTRREDFSRTDPLTPCNVVPEKYRRECFINHAGLLMKFFSNDVKNAANACLKAPDAYVSSCLQSIGLMVSNPSWQPLLSRINGTKTPEAIAWDLCLEFPRDHREQCVFGAIDNILNSDESEVARTKTFCHTVHTSYRMGCYHRVGLALKTHGIDPKFVLGKCTALDGAAVRPCLRGAGEERPADPALVPTASVRRPARQVADGASQDIFKNDALLHAYVKEFGLAQTITRLHALEVSGHGDCHQLAHQAGRLAYALVAMDAFREIAPECQFGGFHGAAESHFKERGTAHLAEDVGRICRVKANAFYRSQCGHGIGHGLLAATNYELPVALEQCDGVPTMQGSCWSGVFMENIVGSLRGHHAVHTTKYVSDDPQYPCTIVADLYKGKCYGFQPARMMQLFAGDFGRIAASCEDLLAAYQDGCFEGMGREASGASQRKPTVTIQSCRQAPEGRPRVQCLMGAVQDSFWDPSGQDPALTFCALLNAKAEKDACYETIFSDAPKVLLSRREIQSFCAKAEASYRRSCLKRRTASN